MSNTYQLLNFIHNANAVNCFDKEDALKKSGKLNEIFYHKFRSIFSNNRAILDKIEEKKPIQKLIEEELLFGYSISSGSDLNCLRLMFKMKTPKLRGTLVNTLPAPIYILCLWNGEDAFVEHKFKYFINNELVNPRRSAGQSFHPHIDTTGEPCLGEWSPVVHKALSSGHLKTTMRVMESFLNTWTRDDAYWNLNDYRATFEGSKDALIDIKRSDKNNENDILRLYPEKLKFKDYLLNYKTRTTPWSGDIKEYQALVQASLDNGFELEDILEVLGNIDDYADKRRQLHEIFLEDRISIPELTTINQKAESLLFIQDMTRFANEGDEYGAWGKQAMYRTFNLAMLNSLFNDTCDLHIESYCLYSEIKHDSISILNRQLYDNFNYYYANRIRTAHKDAKWHIVKKLSYDTLGIVTAQDFNNAFENYVLDKELPHPNLSERELKIIYFRSLLGMQERSESIVYNSSFSQSHIQKCLLTEKLDFYNFNVVSFINNHDLQGLDENTARRLQYKLLFYNALSVSSQPKINNQHMFIPILYAHHARKLKLPLLTELFDFKINDDDTGHQMYLNAINGDVEYEDTFNEILTYKLSIDTTKDSSQFEYINELFTSSFTDEDGMDKRYVEKEIRFTRQMIKDKLERQLEHYNKTIGALDEGN